MRPQAFGLGALVTRTAPRVIDQRSEPRHEGLIEGATLFFRGTEQHVAVVNLSSRGTMIESNIAPRLGESVVIRFDGYSPMHAFVRWVRDGRIGLNFGGEIVLGF
ncbi:MAG: hypothetical protein QOC65_576 [Sphingomonadales bacterium]|nr:hypothetical protein [Sphingomonadales bacterium]